MDNQHSVFVVKDNIATKVDIETGFEQDEMIEVLSGLQGEEKVVTAGHQNLKDQAPVDVVNG
jgi:multidrug efflux pump subunit AcrA (membrane-fusion protein)